MVLLLLHAKAHRRSVMIIMAEEKRGKAVFSSLLMIFMAMARRISCDKKR